MTKQKKKKTASVSPKTNSPRQPMLMLVCGETGVGKTYRNKQEIKRYLQGDLHKAARKVLAFDTNDDDYPEFTSVAPKYIPKLQQIAARRVRPFLADGTPMDDDAKKEVVSVMLKHFTNGLLVLDDIDHYMSGAKGQAMIGALCTVRHKGIDVLLTHQSIAKVTTSEWQNCTWLRLHHQVDDVTRYKERIPKYPLVRMAQLIVEEQYRMATTAYHQGQLEQDEYRKHKSFFVYVNMREQKLVGCSRAAFIRACKRYIDQEEGKRIRLLLNEQDFHGNPVYPNRNAVLLKLIQDYLEYHSLGIAMPL